MHSELTPRQKSFMEYLQREILRRGKTPSLRQAAEDMGVSHAAVAQLIKALEEKGFVKRQGRYSRTIYLLNRSRETSAIQRWLEIPIIGRITAGLPMYAQEEWDGSLVADSKIYRGQNLFALRIKGDSMKNAGILDADLAICEPRQFAQNGEIVVALINREEATVKRFFLHEQHVELRPENEAFQPMRYAFSEVLVQGKVIGIHRGPEEMEKL
jgi:repressor LexA